MVLGETISVRIPDEARDALKAKAKREGTTMSELVRAELDRQIERAQASAKRA
jgi:predicted DNA-binding protein